MTAPVFSRAGVPGIGSVTAYPDGRFILEGDLELNLDQFAELVNTVVMAGLTAADEVRKTLRRRPETTAELEQLADRN